MSRLRPGIAPPGPGALTAMRQLEAPERTGGAEPRWAPPAEQAPAREGPASQEAPPSGWWRRHLAIKPGDPRWARPALVVLLVATAVLYLWGLGASGWANSFYSAAVQAGTKSWKAFFFGSSDAANFITVDKPPGSLWVMELSARLFGVNAWSILAPQALEGVATVAVLYATVRRWFGAAAGLIAGVVVALTPVAALIFRYNNPDALLVLVLVGGAYCLTRAIESGGTGWLVLAGVLAGFGFLTKMLQMMLVVPAFGAAWLVAAPGRLRRRMGQLVVAGGALAVSALWWVVAVMLIPASHRPYIGGSQNNSLWNLIFGYNGFGRLTGNETGSVGGGPAGTSQWGPTGVLRMFNDQFGAQASWLIPAAGILLVAAFAYRFRAKRTDRHRAALILWGGWLVVTMAAFSLSKGIIHPYYTVALAPAIGAVIGIGTTTLWSRRDAWPARAVLAGAMLATAGWAYLLLGRTPNWNPALRPAVALSGALGAVAVLLMGRVGRLRKIAPLIAAFALVVALAGPGAYSVATAATSHGGALPLAGPASASGPGGPGGFRLGGALGAPGFPPRSGANGARLPAGPPPGGLGAGAVPPAGSFPGGPGAPGAAGATGAAGNRPAGGAGGLLNASRPSAALTAALKANASRYTWVAATVGSNQASGYQLATGLPVMAIGGFNGSDPYPTLAQFQSDVAQHKVHYFIGGGGPGGGGGQGGPGGQTAGGSATSSPSSQIASWVAANFTSKTIGGVTVYDLTPTSTTP